MKVSAKMLPAPPKLFPFADACRRASELRRGGKRIVLTNGCFDVLHCGHVFALENAKKLGNSLWVAINSDGSVRELKGPGRPIFSENMRAYVLSALRCVDGIFTFSGGRMAGEILQFAPDVYVKSGDYTVDTLDPTELQALRSVAAEIHFVPFLEGVSTSSIVAKL
jgi:rfaE bifunctional protein nucleotidyltransferase chain/domain